MTKRAGIADIDDPWLSIAAWVIKQAIDDIKNGEDWQRIQAQEFLIGEDARWICNCLGIAGPEFEHRLIGVVRGDNGKAERQSVGCAG